MPEISMHIISIRTGHLRQPIKVKLSHKKWNILAHNAYNYLFNRHLLSNQGPHKIEHQKNGKRKKKGKKEKIITNEIDELAKNL